MLKIIKKTPLIMILIIFYDITFTYMRGQEAFFLKRQLPINSPYNVSPYLLIVVLLIIFVISWYLSYSALIDYKIAVIAMKNSNIIKEAINNQDKSFMYLRKFFFIQAFTFFFTLMGTESFVSLLESTKNIFNKGL